MKTVFDHARKERTGLPEAVFCEGKTTELLAELIFRHITPEIFVSDTQPPSPLLLTRLYQAAFVDLPVKAREALDYNPLSGTAMTGILPGYEQGKVAVVSAGSTDAPVAFEAIRTLTYLGVNHCLFQDLGAAGIWRLGERLEEIMEYDVLIVVAGMDAALGTVLGGLVPMPIIAVPTSVGYGVAKGGLPALQSLLACCSPGVAVMNIDNGYGAACAAARIIRLLNR